MTNDVSVLWMTKTQVNSPVLTLLMVPILEEKNANPTELFKVTSQSDIFAEDAPSTYFAGITAETIKKVSFEEVGE